ncbi:hypothetical protein [Bradyrhizobium sp. ORS 111]|uniref:hypothetical protein n=1 Tax=Bradyrhizobium sp. ORS 111 TaxID=1685958 RepID=UPI003890402B
MTEDDGMIETGKIFRVRCVDNTLQRNTLTLGHVYEVTKVHERDDYYELGSLGRFSRSRFETVCPTSANDDEDSAAKPDPKSADNG